MEQQTVDIPTIIETVTNHCLANKTGDLKELCLNLFDQPNDPKLAEYVVTQGLSEYVKKSYGIIKYLLFEMKDKNPTNMVNIYRNLIAIASATDNQVLMIYLLNLQKEFNIDHKQILEAVCSSENIPFIRDIIINLSRIGITDITTGIVSACQHKLDTNIVFLLKIADDLKMNINYDQCLSVAIKQNSYGIINLLLDKLKRVNQKLLEEPRKEGKIMMIDFFTKKCQEKNIQMVEPAVEPVVQPVV